MKISTILLGIIIVVFIAQMAIPGFTETFYLNSKSPNLFMFVTSIFLHGGLIHLAFNGYALFMFGSILEGEIGKKNFIILFFAAGIAGNITYYATVLLGLIPPIPALGASGAVYGILGALSIFMPNLTVLIFGLIPMKLKHLAPLWILIEAFGSLNPMSGIASAAHLGGLLFGLAAGKHLYKNISRNIHPNWVIRRGRWKA